MLVTGAWSKLLAPGLKKAFDSTYGEMIEYVEVFDQNKKPYTVIKYWWRPDDGKFHVFDLGDEMFVTPDLVRELF